MQTPSSAMRELSRRLVAASRTSSDTHQHELWFVMERLRSALTRVAGEEGFASLLKRALALAGAERPALRGLEVDSQGRLHGLEDLPAGNGAGAAGETAVAVTAQLLELLVTFIGEELTRALVRKAWLDTDLDEDTFGSEADG